VASKSKEVTDKGDEIDHIIESEETIPNTIEMENINTNWKSHTTRSGTGWQCCAKIADPTCRQPNGIPCPYTTASANHMKEHVEGSHLKIKNHFCKECDYTSYRKSGLNRHMKVVHAKTGRYVCQECGHAEHRKMLMNSHMMSVHKMQGF